MSRADQAMYRQARGKGRLQYAQAFALDGWRCYAEGRVTLCWKWKKLGGSYRALTAATG